MCKEEFERTIQSKRPDFTKSRFKWFSPSLDFIKTRVRDEQFNNSRHCPDRYVHLCKFEIDGNFIQTEVQIDRRKNQKITYLGVLV